MSEGVCYCCGNQYQRLGQHWAMSSCEYPEVGERNHNAIKGFLMGDCSIQKSGGRAKNVALQCNMTNVEFLDWLDESLGILSNGYNLYKTPEEIYEEALKTGFFQNPKSPDYYKPIYHWTSMRHPEFNQYEDWYPEPRTKVFPDSLKLNSEILKFWFISDGTKYDDNRDDGKPCIFIAATNELEREENLLKKFDSLRVDPQPVHSIGATGEPQFSIRFRVDDSQKLWEYMGNPIPGFEHKWP